MAPNRKRKKPPPNPARGFATTSTASKPKSQDVHDSEHLALSKQNDEAADALLEDGGVRLRRGPVNEPEKELQDLTPEELEIQLEESSLQILLESYGEKSKKDISRQVTRLQTERRLLRSQAEHLKIRQWLPPEIMQLITDLLEAQMNDINSSNFDIAVSKVGSHVSTEDDLLVKIWTLKRLLPQLGFSADMTGLALRNLLTKQRDSESQILPPSKDSIWGLDECLGWLGSAAAANDLPSFESRDELRQYASSDIRRSEGFEQADESASRAPDSGASTPLSKATPGPQSSLDEASSISSQSESDNEFEPEQQLSKYLSLKSRLYEINPELPDLIPTKQKRSVAKTRNANLDQSQDADQRIARLTARLNKVKSDILFDEDEANRRWADIHFDLAKETAERKRLDIRNDQEQAHHIDFSTRKTNGTNGVEQHEDGGEMLGELFFGLPDTTTNLATGMSKMTTTDTEGSTVEIRDFGKWTGMSPRRVFEEACRARDSSSRVIYRSLSSSTFSKRHSLEVCWSRAQMSSPSIPLDSFAYEYDSRRFKISMMSIACPDSAQSEAYISTVALFLIFASSSKEEKAHLRLPAVWRELWIELVRIRKEETDLEDKNVLRELRSMIEEIQNESNETDGNNSNPIASGTVDKVTTLREAPEAAKTTFIIQPNEMKQVWAAKASTASYQHMLTMRMNLPIWQFKDELLYAIEEHQVIIVCGETGCGKSTQVPSFIIQHELSGGRPCKVYCTEPRRISAISLARRVSEELGERKGDIGTSRSLVGYAIRLESQITAQTRLVYATTGIVMRMLERSDDLGDITHLVLDEVHERSIDSDFLLIVLRKLLIRRPDLKVVLMSATVDAQRFSRYLDQAPIFNVPGRTYPVETRYLEDAIETTRFNAKTASTGVFGDEEDYARDASAKTSLSAENLRQYSPETCNTLLQLDEYRISYDLIVRLLEVIAVHEEYTSYSNAVLIFLPGIAEIKRLNDMLVGHRTFVNGWYIYPLHSTIATEEQERAFLVPPPGYRKIVLGTNIAETGITIPDVTCVIDTGKHKEMRFDERRQLSRLIEAFISRANAKQRRGRAGRVQKGLCFHLFTRERHDKMMAEEQTPEMLRLSLQDLVLRVKICKLGGIEQTLSEALDPPSTKNIRRAIDSLVDVRALTSAEDLTPLGRQLARLPLDVFLGKLILLGTIFGCLDAMLTIAAILSSKSPFSAPMGMRSQADVARLAFRKGDSDLLTAYNAYCAWRRICTSTAGMSEYQFCRKNFMSQQTLSNIEDLKAQLTTALVDASFMRLDDTEKASLNRVRFYSKKRNFVEIPHRHNENNGNDLVLNSVIAWSFYPKLLQREGNGWRNVANTQAVSLHPTSVNKGMDRPPQWLSFYHIMQSSNKFYNAHETSPVEQFALALVCGEAEFKLFSGVMVIDGNRIRFSFDEWKTMIAVKSLRIQVRSIMAQSFRNPGRALSLHQQAWLEIWQKMFEHVSKKSQGRGVS